LRATRAYITSLGTTGLLIASALLTLSVMSAFVAFNGFPGQDVQDPIGTLLVQERQAPVAVPAHPAKVSVLAARRDAAPGTTHRRARTKASGGPLAHANPVKHRTSVPAPSASQPSAPAPQQQTSLTPQTGNVPPSLPDTGTPSLPSTGLPLPDVTIPVVTPPPSNTQVPVDTSGVTGILGSP
jgi:hypothetical protein